MDSNGFDVTTFQDLTIYKEDDAGIGDTADDEDNLMSHLTDTHLKEIQSFNQQNYRNENYQSKLIDTAKEPQKRNFAKSKENLNKSPTCDTSITDTFEKNTKIKFKQLAHLKDHTVIKKLLKTIEHMNKELNKRDELIFSLQKSNDTTSVKSKLSENRNDKENAYLSIEINRLNQQLISEKSENDLLKKRVSNLEKQASEHKCDEATFMSDYIDINMSKKPAPSSSQKLLTNANLENMMRLQNDNKELMSLNTILKSELKKLSDQVELLERKKSLELEINDQFECLFTQKANLEIDNINLSSKLEEIREELKYTLVNYEQELKQIKSHYENEMNELNQIINKARVEYSELEVELTELACINEQITQEKRLLESNVSSIIKEKENQAQQFEKKIDSLCKENDKLKDQLNKQNELSFEQQKQIQSLIQELDHKHVQSEKQSSKKTDDLKRLRQSLNLSNEKLKYQQQKFETELDDLKKKYTKEIDELKFKLEQTTNRNGELSRSSGELRKKFNDLNNSYSELSEKCASYKHSVDVMNKQKKELKEELERIGFLHKKEIDVLVKLKEEHERKYLSQETAMNDLNEKIKKFQKEIDFLNKNNTDLTEKFNKSLQTNDFYKKKYNQIKSSFKSFLHEKEQDYLRKKMQQQSAMQNSGAGDYGLLASLIKELKLDNFLIEESD